MARREREMNKDEGGGRVEPWGTLAELLLACAVNRHGSRSWDSVSTELQSRTSDHHLRALYTPPNCRRRYIDLRRRFAGGGCEDDEETSKAMVDELKKLRVAELRREVEIHDVSIEFLQLKVKRLEEGRGQSFKAKEEREREETDLSTEPDGKKPAKITAGESISGEMSGDREDQSLNESNSTTNRKHEPDIRDDKPDGSEPGAVQTGFKPESICSLALTDAVEQREGTENAAEACDSVTESKQEVKEEETKQSCGEEQSSSKKKRRRRSRFSMASSSGEDEPDADEVLLAAKQIAMKCLPLIKILAIIRSHKNGSVFKRWLRSQETEKYKRMIRQHIDLKTVQRRLDKGFYLHSDRRFFRDLLIVFTNALVFFPKNSNEHSAAIELRKLITTRMAKAIPRPDPKKKQPSLARTQPERAERAPSPPIVVCRRRTSTVSKRAPNPTVATKSKDDGAKMKGKTPNSKVKAKEKLLVRKNNTRISKQNAPVKESSNDDSGHDDEEEEEEEAERAGRRKNGKREREAVGKRGEIEGRKEREAGRGRKMGRGSAADTGRMRKRRRR